MLEGNVGRASSHQVGAAMATHYAVIRQMSTRCFRIKTDTQNYWAKRIKPFSKPAANPRAV